MMSEIPSSWKLVEIEHLLQPLANDKVLQQGWSPLCDPIPSATDEDWGVLKTTAIQEGLFVSSQNKSLPSHLKPRPQIEVVPGDILMTCAGPRNRCGVTCLVRSTRKRLLMSGKMYRFRNDPLKLDAAYLEAFLLSQSAKHEIDRMKTGISDSGLNLTHDRFKKLPVPVAPIKEQHRIVAKIEELFSELDKGIENMKTARAQLKVYRQALLKHAFEGKLTAQWRADNKDKLETAETLLKRIQLERAERYEQQLADWGTIGKQGSKPRAPKSLPPITAEELAELTELPDRWGWVKVGNVSSVGTGITPLKGHSAFYENGKIPWVTSGALNEPFVTEASDYITELALSETNLRIYPKHTLLIALYGEGKTRGKCSELLIEATTNQAIAAVVQVGTSEKLRKYMKWFFQKNYEDIRLKSSGGVQPNLNLSIIDNTVFPMCSIEEAIHVVDAIESKLSEVDHLDQTILMSLQQAEALRQSILKKAFSGQLVPQDPHDEPASTLLARIKVEKAVQPNKKKVRT